MNVNAMRTARHWDGMTEGQSQGKTGLFWWEAGSELLQQINLRISGKPDEDWIDYSLQKYWAGRTPLDRCLSLGCGSGWLERRLAIENAFRNCDAYDISEKSIREAVKLAAEQGFHHINYRVSDINTLELPEYFYDAVFIHGAMHHFEALEHVTGQICRTLKPGGTLFLNEYIGRNRFQFSDRQKEVGNLCLQLIPGKFRHIIPMPASFEGAQENPGFMQQRILQRVAEKIRQGDLLNTIKRKVSSYRAKKADGHQIKLRINFPTYHGVIADDPSEAIRSEDILQVLHNSFEVCEVKYYGGNIFQFLLADIAGNFDREEDDAKALIQMITQIEDTMILCGEFSSDYAYIAARPQ